MTEIRKYKGRPTFGSFWGQSLSRRTEIHLARKFWHVGMGLVIVSLFQFAFTRAVSAALLGFFLALSLLMEFCRLRVPEVNRVLIQVLSLIMRKEEAHRPSGMPFFLASCFLSVLIFPKSIAILSMLYLTLGDPIASYFGLKYGDALPRMNNGKSLIGTAAAVLTCFATTLLVGPSIGFPDHALVAASIVGGLVGGMSELVPLEVDDNFSIPIISGFSLWILLMILGS